MNRGTKKFVRGAIIWVFTGMAVFFLSVGPLWAQDDDDDEDVEFESMDMYMDAPMIMSPGRSLGGSASVTAGGAQDINHARQLIEGGYVPSSISLIAEGLLSEHDLPVDGPACERLFCPLLSTGYAPSFDSERSEIWVQLGFNSNIDLGTFERRPLNLAIVLDRSGSMGGLNIEIVKAAANALVDQLGPDDRLALVSYASVPEVDLESTAADDHDVFQEIIDGWAAEGSTNLEGALDLGYREVARHAGDSEYENRVIVFTDMLPNVGITTPESFEGMSSRWAVEGINLTVIGVGYDFGQQLGLTLSQLRGGNYYFLRDTEEAGKIFGEELDFMVTPVAFDVDMEIAAGPGFELTGVYGVPKANDDGEITTHIATLFLSQRGGAIMLRFIPSETTTAAWSPESPICNVELSYTTVEGDQNSASAFATFAMPALPPEAPIFEQEGPYRAWMLVQQSIMMQTAIENYNIGDQDLARAQLGELAGTIRTVAAETNNDALLAEADLVERLLETMSP